jgi:hypothetical protein
MRWGLDAPLLCDVERVTKVDHACAVAAAAAHDFNNELTVILSTVSKIILALEPDHPVRPYLLDLQSAAQRCATKSLSLLQYGGKRRSGSASLEQLLKEQLLKDKKGS